MENPLRGLPAPPPLGAAALPPGTYAGQVVLVTGGGTGLSKAVAAEFARLGADLLIAGRRTERLKAAQDDLAAVPGAGRVAVPGAGRVAAAVGGGGEEVSAGRPRTRPPDGPRTAAPRGRRCR